MSTDLSTPPEASASGIESLSPPETPRRRKGVVDAILAKLGSYHIATVVFIMLIVLTLLGTFSQKEHGLYDSQRWYFESWIVPAEARPWGIPLPGVALLLAIMFVNVLAGGILRVRKNVRTLGVVISHLSMLGLIAAGAVSMWFKTEGHMRVFEGESSNLAEAFQDWVLEVRRLGDDKEPVYMIPDAQFRDATGHRTRTFFRSGWPFELKVSGYVRNGAVTTAGDPRLKAAGRAIEDHTLVPLPVESQNEANLAGAFVDVVDLAGKPLGAAILGQTVSGGRVNTPSPATFEADGQRYSLTLTRQKWELPFTVKLDDFVAEYYPGTRKAKSYESHISVSKPGEDPKKFHIYMNNPLRDSGYVAYQTSYDSESPPGQERYTVLTVVKNPSDQWPLWCMIAAALGLAIHFILKLSRFITRSSGVSTSARPTL